MPGNADPSPQQITYMNFIWKGILLLKRDLNSICRDVMHSNNNVVKHDIQLSSTVNDKLLRVSQVSIMSGIVYECHEQLHGKTSKRVRQAMV